MNVHGISESLILSANLLKIVNRKTNQIRRLDVSGGGVQHIATLKAMQLDDQNTNWEKYSNWADSIRSFPGVIKQKVKEKELNLKT